MESIGDGMDCETNACGIEIGFEFGDGIGNWTWPKTEEGGEGMSNLLLR